MFLGLELKPSMEQRFRVTDESVLMGESAAGLFVTEALLRRPQLFRGDVAASSMLWWDGQLLARQADSLLRKPFLPARRLYLTMADEDGPMREAVDQETHGTIFHPAALSAVRRLFAVSDSVN